MRQPPRDDTERTIPHDDPGIRADDGLIRYIIPRWHILWDDNLGAHRLSTAAFSESSTPYGGMSVDLEALMIADGLPNNARIPTEDGCGAVRLISGEVRGLGLRVGSDPIPANGNNGGNPYHGAVWGIRGRKSIKNRLLRMCTWIRKAAGIS